MSNATCEVTGERPTMRTFIDDNDKEAAYQFNRAYDKITEAESRLTFLLESVPVSSTVGSFSSDGIHGMAWMVGDLVDGLSEARQILKKLAISEETRQAA